MKLYRTTVFILGVMLINFSDRNTSIAAEKGISDYCQAERCTKPVTEIRAGKFSFTAKGFPKGCSEDCTEYHLKFGVPKKMITPSTIYSSNAYRIINGPVPFSLVCIDGIPAWFEDLPPASDLKGFDGVDTFDGRHRQKGERIYYHNNPYNTFPFFSKEKTAIGILLTTSGGSGGGGSTIYIFDTKTQAMSKISGDICGSGVDYVRNDDGIVIGTATWDFSGYFGPPNFSPIYVDLPVSFKNNSGKDQLFNYIISNPIKVISRILSSLQINFDLFSWDYI